MADETVLQYRHVGGLYQFEVWSAGDEFTALETWIGTQLAGLAAGGVHQWPAPDDTPTPFIAFRFVTALPDQYNYGAGQPALTPLHYKVWACDQAENYDTVAPIAAQIKQALRATQVEISGATIYSAKRLIAQKDEQIFL